MVYTFFFFKKKGLCGPSCWDGGQQPTAGREAEAEINTECMVDAFPVVSYIGIDKNINDLKLNISKSYVIELFRTYITHLLSTRRHDVAG